MSEDINLITYNTIKPSFFGDEISGIKEFEIWEHLATEMTHGIVMPRNQIGYDVLAENYKYQIKHSISSIKGDKKRHGETWEVHFRIPVNRDNDPDFFILYGETNTGLFCFLIPYVKILTKLNFSHGSKIDGRTGISTRNTSWIWNWYLSNTDYYSFIKRRNELNRYIQLALIS